MKSRSLIRAAENNTALRVGLVSDLHGLLDPKLAPLLARCALVLNAGDTVKPAVHAALEALAPGGGVRSVRGNNDLGPSFERLPEALLVELGTLTALLVHDLGARERPGPPAAGLIARHRPEIVVHGHSHRPAAALVDGRLYVNPGSAGPRRFSLPRTAAVLELRRRRASVAFFDLAGDAPAPYGERLEAAL
jgi:putative phosphoesterase